MTNKYVDAAKQIVLKACEGKGFSVYLFGSRARGDEDRWSDIDIGIDSNKPLPKHFIALLKDQLEESTVPYEVDLVDMQNCQKDLRANILKEGILWTS